MWNRLACSEGHCDPLRLVAQSRCLVHKELHARDVHRADGDLEGESLRRHCDLSSSPVLAAAIGLSSLVGVFGSTTSGAGGNEEVAMAWPGCSSSDATERVRASSASAPLKGPVAAGIAAAAAAAAAALPAAPASEAAALAGAAVGSGSC